MNHSVLFHFCMRPLCYFLSALTPPPQPTTFISCIFWTEYEESWIKYQTMFCWKEICTEPNEQWNYEIQGVQREELSVFPCILLLILNITFFSSFKNIISLEPPHNCREFWQFSCYFYLADIVEDVAVHDAAILWLLCSPWLVNNLS